MKATTQFREATSADINILIQLRLAFIQESAGPIDPEAVNTISKQLSSYFKQHLGHDFHAYLAFDHGEAAAVIFLCVSECPANLSFLTGKTGKLLNVYTKPEFRKRGYAGELLKISMARGKKENLAYIELMATEQGYPLYKKAGFVQDNPACTPMRYTYK